MSRYVTAYRLLVRLYPSQFRAEYEEEMVRLFAEQLRDARTSGRRYGPARTWLAASVDVVLTAPAVHAVKEAAVAQSADGPMTPALIDSAGRRRAVVVASLPMWFAAVLWIMAPGFMDSLYATPPAIVGLPAGIMILLGALAWAAIGLLVAWRYGTSARRLAAILVVFVLPATAAVILGPAIVLVVMNLAV